MPWLLQTQGRIYTDLYHPHTLHHGRPWTLLAGSAHISVVTPSRRPELAPGAACPQRSTKLSLGGQMALNRFIRRSLHPEKKW